MTTSKEEREMQEALDQAREILGAEMVHTSGVLKGSAYTGTTDLSDVTFNRENGDYVGLPPGGYMCTLAEVQKTVRKKYQSNEEEPCLQFKYVEKKSGRYFFERLRPSLHRRAKLTARLQAMVGSLLEPSMSDKLVAELIQAQVGKDFLVQVSLSNDGKWNNVQHVMPMPS